MIKEAIGTAETVEEALEAAKTELFALLGEDIDFDIDVISQPKKKVLGMFGGSPAKVRVYTEIADPAPKKAKSKAPKKAKESTPAPKAERKIEKKSEKTVKEETKEPQNAVDSDTLDKDTPAAKAVAYLKTILTALGCIDIKIKVVLRDNGALLILTGEGLGACIGRRGETLDAIQYLSSLAANSASDYYKISIDIGNYRERREKTLISLANKISSQVLRNGRSRSLEPMNPYERRIIHTAIQEIDGVSSHSVGEGDRRHIVITPDNPAPKTAEKTEAREPKKDSAALPLYGKIK
ncbi:MAG: KH domain-containing protein [Ruminococcaceae bacterium]|nr:KH domain-containing protein [Oscillospiraceae bacterium]